MARKLKAFTTSIGFFDLAVAAPSMKAALQAWDASQNLFHQGFARQTDDAKIVAATMARPGVVLRRPVGTNAPFAENSGLPQSLPAGKDKELPRGAPKAKRAEPHKPKVAAKVLSVAEARAAKQAAAAFEKARQHREREERNQDAARKKHRERRETALRAAEAGLEDAQARHDQAAKDIAAEREKLEQRAEREAARWEKEKRKLSAALRAAGDQ
ncbi:MAG TPA: cell envelope biogenesis protein TolA [Rhizomicrobium sp.]